MDINILNKIKDTIDYLGIGFVSSRNVLLIDLNKLKKQEMNTIYDMIAKMIADDFDEENIIKERFVDNKKNLDKNVIGLAERMKPFAEAPTNITNNGDWKTRLLTEYYELSDRLKKLRRTLVKINAGTIEFKGKSTMEMLYNQEKAMDTYKQILELRLEKEGIEFNMA